MAFPPVVYGTAEQVATMASIWTRDGEWIDPDPLAIPPVEGTNPTLAEVNVWLENVSAQLNIALGSMRFVTPIIEAEAPNAYKAVSQYVVSLVADLCHYKNSSGRFFTERLVERGITPMAAILRDLGNWIQMNEAGMLADGVKQRVVPVVGKQLVIRTMGSFPSRRRHGR